MADPTLQELNQDVVFYSDTFISTQAVGAAVDRLEGIIRKLASIGIGTANTDAIKRGLIHHWQRWADDEINAKLEATYRLPLIRITRAGRNLDQEGTAVGFFPSPIPDIATDLVVAKIVIAEYTDVDPNVNTTANYMLDRAMKRLDEIGGIDGLVGTIKLEGQELKTRTPFAPPGAMPRNTPGARR